MRRFIFSPIFLFILSCSLDLARAREIPRQNDQDVKPVAKDKADIDTLELVQIMFRHGDRTPIVQYPNDPLRNESYWYPYATGFESITKKGKQMQYELGKYLRQRYEGFINNTYSPKEIFVQSSDADRAIMSALSNMAGMWPPTPEDPKSQWDSNLAWQPIPVHTIPKSLDNFINFGAPCPRFKELKEEYIKRSPFAKSINENKDNAQLCAYVKEHTGVKECDFETISDIWDTLHIQKSYNLTLPPWVTDSIYQQMEKLAPMFFDPRVMVPNDEAKKVKAGPLLSFLVRNMDVRRNSSDLSTEVKDKTVKSKMYILSGHDSTSAIALGAIGVFDTQFPGYASAAIFEMHRGEGDQEKEHFVRVFFRNDTTEPLHQLKIPNCGDPCNLNKFKQLFSSITIDGEEWKASCKPGGSENKSTSGSSTTKESGAALLGTFMLAYTLSKVQ